MDSIIISEEQLIDIIQSRCEDLNVDDIELKERCLTNDGGLKLYFDTK